MEKLKGTLLSERDQYVKPICCVIPSMRLSGKGKIIETVKISLIFRNSEERVKDE